MCYMVFTEQITDPHYRLSSMGITSGFSSSVHSVPRDNRAFIFSAFTFCAAPGAKFLGHRTYQVGGTFSVEAYKRLRHARFYLVFCYRSDH